MNPEWYEVDEFGVWRDNDGNVIAPVDTDDDCTE